MSTFQIDTSNSNGACLDDNPQAVGLQIDYGHTLIGDDIDTVAFKLSSESGGTSGNLEVAHITGTGTETVSSPVAASTMLTYPSESWIEFTLSSTVTIAAADKIVVRKTDGGYWTTNRPCARMGGATSNGENSHAIWLQGGNYNSQNYDISVQLSNSSSGGGSGGDGGDDGGSSGGSDGLISGDGGSSYAPEYAMKLNIGYIR